MWKVVDALFLRVFLEGKTDDTFKHCIPPSQNQVLLFCKNNTQDIFFQSLVTPTKRSRARFIQTRFQKWQHGDISGRWMEKRWRCTFLFMSIMK